MFFFDLLCLFGRPHRVLSLLVSVRPFVSYDTLFQVIKKNTKKYKIFKI